MRMFVGCFCLVPGIGLRDRAPRENMRGKDLLTVGLLREIVWQRSCTTARLCGCLSASTLRSEQTPSCRAPLAVPDRPSNSSRAAICKVFWPKLANSGHDDISFVHGCESAPFSVASAQLCERSYHLEHCTRKASAPRPCSIRYSRNEKRECRFRCAHYVFAASCMVPKYQDR